MLCAAAQPHEVGRWRESNRWADSIPIVTFGGDDLDPLGTAFGARAGMTPWRADNAPYSVVRVLEMLADQPLTTPERSSLDRYLTAVALVAAHAPPGPTWWVCAEGDQGIGAVRVAATRGACVALAAIGQQLGMAGVALANRLGVDVAMHDVSAGMVQ